MTALSWVNFNLKSVKFLFLLSIDRDKRPSNIPEGNPNIKPFLSSFSGTEPVPKKEVSFESWKQKTKFFINSYCYSELTVNQIMRNSLRGQARKVVNTLWPNVS